jgi:RHS repeat-associated protein
MTGGGTEQQATAVTVFVSDQQQEVAEYAGGAEPASPSKRYVYGDYVDEPVVLLVGAGTTAPKYYYHQNSLYSVAALTDQAGAVQERYAYTAYGKPLFCDASGTPLDPQQSALGNSILYTGRRLDTETGLQYSRARYYSADLGKFIPSFRTSGFHFPGIFPWRQVTFRNPWPIGPAASGACVGAESVR